MEHMKILALDNIIPKALESIRTHGCQVDEKNVTDEELPDVLREYDAVILRSATTIDKDTLHRMGSDFRLRLIVRAGVGLDNIDVVQAEKMNIRVKHTPQSSVESVAELALGHMFVLARNLHRSNRSVPKGEWNKKHYLGMELTGKTLGIIGFGRIGQSLAQKAEAIGMNVHYYDIEGPSVLFPHYSYTEFKTLLETSDFISLHVPKIPGTPPVLGKAELDLVKPGAILINCSRGGLIDENALLQALDTGRLNGVGLDVFDPEPPEMERLLLHELISFSPHLGASTVEAQDRIGSEIVELFKEFCKGADKTP